MALPRTGGTGGWAGNNAPPRRWPAPSSWACGSTTPAPAGSPPPTPGGNSTPYDYCSADPVNCTDLDGNQGISPKWKKRFAKVGKIAEYGSYIPGPIGTASAAISTGAYAASGNKKKAVEMGITTGAALLGCGACAKGGVKAYRLAKSGKDINRMSGKLWMSKGNKSPAQMAYKHYKKHVLNQKDTKAVNSLDYVRKAHRFLNGRTPLAIRRNSGPIQIRWNPLTNSYGIKSRSTGAPISFYKPTSRREALKRFRRG